MKLRDQSNFKEMRYAESEWFSNFTLGHDEPGGRNWLDEGEKSLGGNETDVEYHINRWLPTHSLNGIVCYYFVSALEALELIQRLNGSMLKEQN